jgi:hypothetical protein
MSFDEALDRARKAADEQERLRQERDDLAAQLRSRIGRLERRRPQRCGLSAAVC